ncbi:alpha/beta hydrolase fold domain-containing protein [Conexibacter sp. W3-3-2]|uniref:alpha/beta hydrolase n=1 Tax=Conexibacter sp. W3-3-2 TaxID=2675227 RepID=UPI0012B7FF6F|nr:alpha/beta hydrolase [Conexibacter sp. W3-3-2]MTD45342.1 alpha/beta hydrolase fold domain-containing protein [Conexibacter sp. W3-3-2]
MRISDRISATLMHASARYTVRYGKDLRFAGQDLPAPARRKLPTRHGRVTVYEYGGTDGPAHVHFHGGAWLMRYPQMDDWWCRYVAATAGVRVVNVDFRTGPYVQYPVAQEQCHDVAAAIAQEAPVTVGGFSSGGGNAASVCLQARDRGTFTARLQVLGVPALDLASELPTGAGMISPSLRGLVRRVYFPDPASRAEPYASPVLADDLSGLPPAIVLTAERDTLRRDGDTYARRLREAGVEVVHDVTPGADHYFLTEDPVRARTTMAMVAERVRDALSAPGA